MMQREPLRGVGTVSSTRYDWLMCFNSDTSAFYNLHPKLKHNIAQHPSRVNFQFDLKSFVRTALIVLSKTNEKNTNTRISQNKLFVSYFPVNSKIGHSSKKRY